jgi:phosphohistidine swiveling domain-containing protein
MSKRQIVFPFAQAERLGKERIGGKAAGLAIMTRLGLPVPEGFVVATGANRAFLQHSEAPTRLNGQLRRAMKALERETSKRFGGSIDPLLVSVRSGAPISMPGMMDTILNLGMNDYAWMALERNHGRLFANLVDERFIESFRKVTGSQPSDQVWEQLFLAVEAVWYSWLSDRAKAYRASHNVPENMGTAVTVQRMVFGNLDDRSGTGVLFSRNVATGANELYGEFLPQAQGEDVVSGTVTPQPLVTLRDVDPKLYDELAEYARVLEEYEGDVVDIEFTVENGKLWLLQYRRAKRSAQASATFAVHQVWAKAQTKAEAVKSLTADEIDNLRRPEFDLTRQNGAYELTQGLPASPGAAIGYVAFSNEHALRMQADGKPVVLFRQDTDPNDLPGMLASVAIVTGRGGYTSHAALVARSMHKPAVVGAEQIRFSGEEHCYVQGNRLWAGDHVSVDGTTGVVYAGHIPFKSSMSAKEVNLFLRWHRELNPVRVLLPDFTLRDNSVSMNTYLNDFYLSEVMKSLAVGSPLEKEALRLSDTVTERVGQLMLTYLILAVAAELRHSADSGNSGETQEFRELRSFFGISDGGTREDSQKGAVSRLDGKGQDAYVRFTKLATDLFRNGKWGSAFGGYAWGRIAEATHLYFTEQMNLTVFIDHAFDLQHNGGRLFDKHHMVTWHTEEGTLRHQLEAKKHAQKSQLRDRLLSLHRALSPEVAELWEKGAQSGVWG